MKFNTVNPKAMTKAYSNFLGGLGDYLGTSALAKRAAKMTELATDAVYAIMVLVLEFRLGYQDAVEAYEALANRFSEEFLGAVRLEDFEAIRLQWKLLDKEDRLRERIKARKAKLESLQAEEALEEEPEEEITSEGIEAALAEMEAIDAQIEAIEKARATAEKKAKKRTRRAGGPRRK